MNDLLSIFITLWQKNEHKVAIETLKKSLDNNGMSKDYNDVFKSYLDIGVAFFEDQDCEKAKLECLKLVDLLQKYKKT